MNDQNSFEQIARDAADPNVDQEYLRQIAAQYPGLHPVIAENPAAYQGLLDWLASFHDPATDQALQRRYAAQSGGASGAAATFPDSAAPVGATSPAGSFHSSADAPASGGAATAAAGASPVSGTAEQPVFAPQMVAASPQQVLAKERKNNSKVVLLIVLGILAATLVLGALSIALGWIDLFGKPAVQPTPQPAVTVETTPENVAPQASPETPAPQQEPTPEKQEPTPEVVRFPAPAGAQNLPNFISPSQNIGCSFGADEVYCSIITREYAQEGAQACAGMFGLKIVHNQPAVAVCNDASAQRLTEGMPILEYGGAATVGNFACTMSQTGVNCWDTVSGKEFSMRRADYQLGQR